jgi:predicted phage terminase large subunit-like protein
LYPSKHGLQKLLKIKDSNPRTFSSLYQQRPSPLEGALIKREYFEVITPSQAVSMMAGREIIKHMVVDTAFTTQSKNDPCACLTFFIVDNILVIVDFWKDRLEMPDLISKLSAHNGR